MIAQVIKRVVLAEDAVYERQIPGVGQSLVKEGEMVAPSDIIARYEASSGQRLVKLASVLKVRGNQVHKYLVKKVGDRIYRGEVIATKKGLLGVGKKQLISPADGILDSLLPDGSIMIKFLPTPRKLAAAVSGMVKIVTETSITIETQVAKVYGFGGAGILREGTLRTIAKPNEFILPAHIDSTHQGEILVGGAMVSRATIEKAVTLGVKGLVVGGINFRDFASLGTLSDVGITLLVTEGFGIKPMGDDIYNFLNNKNDHFAFISGRERQITFPLVEKKVLPKSDHKSWREIALKDRVNVLDSRGHETNLGSVTKITPAETWPKVGVKLDSGAEIEIPSTNLQIIE